MREWPGVHYAGVAFKDISLLDNSPPEISPPDKLPTTLDDASPATILHELLHCSTLSNIQSHAILWPVVRYVEVP